MKHNEKDKTLLRRYLDDLYTVEDVSKLADHLAVPEPEGILEELAADVWDESASQQPLTDLEREKSKKEAHRAQKTDLVSPHGNCRCSCGCGSLFGAGWRRISGLHQRTADFLSGSLDLLWRMQAGVAS